MWWSKRDSAKAKCNSYLFGHQKWSLCCEQIHEWLITVKILWIDKENHLLQKKQIIEQYQN